MDMVQNKKAQTKAPAGRKIDDALLKKLCEHHKLKYEETKKKIEGVTHRVGTKMLRDGSKKEVIYIKSEGGGEHEITTGDDGIYYCTCPSWIFKGGREHHKPCKHLVYAIVYGIADAEKAFQYFV